MTKAKQKVMRLAIKSAMSPITYPCTIYKKIPITDMRYIPSEMAFVSFVCKTLITCGTNDNVVNMPAIVPIIFFSP